MLVLTNGTISWSEKGTVSLDEQGNPIQEKGESYSAPCFIETSRENLTAKNDDGSYSERSYTVSIDMDGVGAIFNPKYVNLTENHRGDLGGFTVKRIEFYDITQSVKVWV